MRLTNRGSQWVPAEGMKCFEYCFKKHIHNISFSLKRMNGPNKLQYYIRIGWKSLPGTDTSFLGPIVNYKEDEEL